MIVANTTPLINFAVIGQLALLQHLFGRITIPRAVIHELAQRQQRYPDVLTIVQQSGFVDVMDVQQTALHDALLVDLDAGGAEAIKLAVEHHATLIILDEVVAIVICPGQAMMAKVGEICQNISGAPHLIALSTIP